MRAESPFQELMRRVRAGDADAAAELVRGYEQEIRRVVRVRLTDPRLRRTLDSMDVCQSVLANFFVRVSAGQYDLDEPEKVLKLLVTMARNKLLDKARNEQAGRRDQRRVEVGNEEALAEIPDQGDSPSKAVAGQELLEAARRLMSPEERYLAEQRAMNRNWADIAAELGGSPEGLRKQLARAMDRVSQQLGLDTQVGG